MAANKKKTNGSKKSVGKSANRGKLAARSTHKTRGSAVKLHNGKVGTTSASKSQVKGARKGPREEIQVAFVPGVQPDRFIRRWRDLQRERPPALRAVATFTPIPWSQQEAAVNEYDLVLARLPFLDERLLDRCHRVDLWTEAPVVVISKDNDLAAAEDDVSTVDLIHAGVNLPEASRDDAKERVEVAATGVGYAAMPLSLARLHARKDVTYRIVSDFEPTQIALVWFKGKDRQAVQDMVGLMRGRRAHSSR